ncbi:MAG TPA: hypothetical protein DCM04_05700 [Saprospirales bacterium]|nr:hypothetical protein [Saprospirales bacterium]|tara:strand:- start:194 stop:586 length:393 start_codon:yes stop_codon:yes gene_type:complete
MYTKTIGYCGVDSGQLFITDPCYIKHQEQGNGQWNMEWLDTDDGRSYKTLPDPTLDGETKNFYSKVCEANGREQAGVEVELGVAFGTTHGDGNYAVQGIFDDDDVMVGIFMDLDGRVKGEFNYETEDMWS